MDILWYTMQPLRQYRVLSATAHNACACAACVSGSVETGHPIGLSRILLRAVGDCMQVTGRATTSCQIAWCYWCKLCPDCCFACCAGEEGFGWCHFGSRHHSSHVFCVHVDSSFKAESEIWSEQVALQLLQSIFGFTRLLVKWAMYVLKDAAKH